MGALSKALPREQRAKTENEPTLHSERGMYSGFFLGMSEEFTWTSEWANDKCRACKGAKTYNNETCFLCGGHGKKTEQRVKLRYELENSFVEEEEVSFKLSGGGVGKDGTTPISPSTLFVRLRSLSGLKNPTPADLDEWYSALPEPIRIPCSVVINDNRTQTALKITDVLARGGSSAQPAAHSNGNSSSWPADLVEKAKKAGWTGVQLRDEWIACSKNIEAVHVVLDRILAPDDLDEVPF